MFTMAHSIFININQLQFNSIQGIVEIKRHPSSLSTENFKLISLLGCWMVWCNVNFILLLVRSTKTVDVAA